MINFYKMLVSIFNYGTPAGRKLYLTAVECLGTDASPNDKAPDEYGCAETVNDIVYKAFGDYAGGDLSTYRMYRALKNNRMFVKVSKPLKGDIILSPTGYGGQNGINNGHTGIIGANNVIMSNSSATGKFEENYTIETWTNRYVVKGGYPIYYFRRLLLS